MIPIPAAIKMWSDACFLRGTLGVIYHRTISSNHADITRTKLLSLLHTLGERLDIAFFLWDSVFGPLVRVSRQLIASDTAFPNR